MVAPTIATIGPTIMPIKKGNIIKMEYTAPTPQTIPLYFLANWTLPLIDIL